MWPIYLATGGEYCFIAWLISSLVTKEIFGHAYSMKCLAAAVQYIPGTGISTMLINGIYWTATNSGFVMAIPWLLWKKIECKYIQHKWHIVPSSSMWTSHDARYICPHKMITGQWHFSRKLLHRLARLLHVLSYIITLLGCHYGDFYNA